MYISGPKKYILKYKTTTIQEGNENEKMDKTIKESKK